MPVAHRDHAGCVHSGIAQRRFERARLLFGVATDGRTSADDLVMMLDLFRARGGDELGQRTASKAREGEINDVRIAKQVEKEGFDRLEGVGPAELKEHYADTTLVFSHFVNNSRERTDECKEWRALSSTLRNAASAEKFIRRWRSRELAPSLRSPRRRTRSSSPCRPRLS